MPTEERITCEVCNAKVKASSLDRHVITLKHKKHALAPPGTPKPHAEPPAAPFKCTVGPHKVSFD